jgi:death on curing protein
LEASLAAPQAGFGGHEQYPTLAAKASALLYSLAKGHCCSTGNKRLAYILTTAFAIKNGQWLWSDPDELRDKVVEIAASDPKKPDQVRSDLTIWIEHHLLDATEAHVRMQAKLRPGQ